MRVSFARLTKGLSYSRQDLARLWGYQGYQALARGFVTPGGDNKIILFITEDEGQQHTVQKYSNHFDGRILVMDGPEDHFAEQRVLAAGYTNDEIHLFYREEHSDDFTYVGEVRLVTSQINKGKPSRFTLRVRQGE
jgi:putative restriction endonuclease